MEAATNERIDYAAFEAAGYNISNAESEFDELDFDEDCEAGFSDESFSHEFGIEQVEVPEARGDGRVCLVWFDIEEHEIDETLTTSIKLTTPEPDWEEMWNAGVRRTPARFRNCGQEVHATVKGKLVTSNVEGPTEVTVGGQSLSLYRHVAVYDWSCDAE